MLLNNFFSIVAKDLSPGQVNATLRIHGEHPIFQGHFPGFPVVPGVTMMQMVREIMEVQFNKRLRILGVDNMKFLSVINPDQNQQVNARVTYSDTDGNILLNATLYEGSVTFFKLVKATLQQA